uniref:HAT C-terminal dimerisation domain-containing protein n=1 Tax=Lactuca sativa TaxID=4236 RepID=A0A9R1WJY1_LACSA|nr:hypothetical protein LSAT_V11C100042980 [Lactuca sativa]
MMKMCLLITLKLKEQVKQQSRRKGNIPKGRLAEPIMIHSKCKKCGTLLKTESSRNGTSSMIKHTERCKMNPKNLEKKTIKPNHVKFQKKNENGENIGELPFKFVENESFIEYTNALNGKVVLPCRTTISNRVTDYFLEEKAKLFKFFSNPLSNVHLTTDCWTGSCQRSSYMEVMTHFIDEGEDIGRTLLTCLQEWGINNCMQKAVKYIRNSTQRIQRFKECMKELNVEPKKFLCNDSPTQWNSTYELLKIAVELEKVFGMFEVKDLTYVRDVLTPSKEDFNICKAMVGFLEKFKVKTNIVSTSTKPMAHRFFGEYVMYTNTLRNGRLVPNFKFIKSKNPQKDLMLNSEVILKAKALIQGLQQRFENFFYFYKSKFDNTNSSQNQKHGHEDVVVIDEENDFMGDLIVQSDYPSASMETELTRYLNEQSKQNTSRYPIVSRMGKDILGLQISTVASEAAFSTSGRILDPYLTNLSANIVETLVCTQDWVRKSRKPIVDNIDEILKDDEVAKALEEAIKNGDGKGKQPINIPE